MTHSSPSSTAEVLSEARSEPESGSLKPWHQRIEPFMIPGRYSFFCSALPHWRIVVPTRVSPKKSARRGSLARANSSESTTTFIVLRPLAPHPVGHEAQLPRPPQSLLSNHPFTASPPTHP